MPRRKAQQENFAILRIRQVKFDYDFDLNPCPEQNDGRTYTLMLDMRNFLSEEVDVRVSPTQIRVTGRQYQDLECSEFTETFPLPPGIVPRNVDAALNEKGVLRLQAPIEFQGGPRRTSTPDSGRSRTSSDSRSERATDSPDPTLQRIKTIPVKVVAQFGPGLETVEDVSNSTVSVALGSMIQTKLPTGSLEIEDIQVEVDQDWFVVSGNGKTKRFKVPSNLVITSMTGILDRYTKTLILTGFDASRLQMIEEPELDPSIASVRDRIGQLLNASAEAEARGNCPGIVAPILNAEQEEEILAGLVERQKKALGKEPEPNPVPVQRPTQKLVPGSVKVGSQDKSQSQICPAQQQKAVPKPPPPPQPKTRVIHIAREGEPSQPQPWAAVTIQPQVLTTDRPADIGNFVDITNDLELPNDIKHFKVEFKVNPYTANDIGVTIYKNAVCISAANPKLTPGIFKTFKLPPTIKPEDIKVTLLRENGTLRISTGMQPLGNEASSAEAPLSGNIVRKVDVSGYQPNEITVSFENNWVVVRGTQVATEQNNFRSRELMKKFTLPSDLKISDLTCTQTPDGSLNFIRT